MTQCGDGVKCIGGDSGQVFVQADGHVLEIEASGKSVRRNFDQSTAPADVDVLEFGQKSHRIRFDRLERVSSDVQASESGKIAESVGRNVGQIVVGQFESAKSSESSKAELVDGSDAARGQVEDRQRSEGEERVSRNDRQRVARQVEFGERRDGSERLGRDEVQVVVFEMQNLKVFETHEGSVADLCDPVSSEIDLLQTGRVHEQVFRQRADFVVPQGKDFESAEADEGLVGDVADLVRVETQKFEAGLTGERVVGHRHDVVVAQVYLHELSQKSEMRENKKLKIWKKNLSRRSVFK